MIAGLQCNVLLVLHDQEGLAVLDHVLQDTGEGAEGLLLHQVLLPPVHLEMQSGM
jgi:hypothetical protein